MGGGNDVHFGSGRKAAISAFDDLVAKAKATGFVILSLNIIQRGSVGTTQAQLNSWRVGAMEINKHMSTHPDVVNVDLSSVYSSFNWIKYPWNWPAMELPKPEYVDAVHLSAVGNAAVANYVLNYVLMAVGIKL